MLYLIRRKKRELERIGVFWYHRGGLTEIRSVEIMSAAGYDFGVVGQ